jgi:hypothetical protein
MFSSTSSEVSTTSQYQSELSKEATVTTQTSASASANILGYKFGSDESFSKSEKSREFAMDRTQTQTTTFQSRALCTEFEARLQRFYKHELQDAFQTALDSLPSTFDKNNDLHKGLFGDFLNEYGTHYVNYVVLGAKQIYSLEMKSLDVLALTQKNIDVSTSTSSKTMFGFEQSAEVTASGTIPGTPVELSVTGNVTVQVGGEVSESTFMSESENVKNLNSIRMMTQRVVETNVGGTPPADGKWQTWASTAKDRPMPIVYELSELTVFMEKEVAEAFADYIEFYLEQGGTEERTILDALHYGVSRPDGTPIASYTLDPTFGQRTRSDYLARTDDSEIPASEFHRYDLVWDGSKVINAAVFLTIIRDNLSPNKFEDFFEFDEITGESITNDDLSLTAGLQIPFGLILEPGRATAGIYGVSNPKLLESFSYLAADDLPANVTYTAGVVHPQGYRTNREFGSDLIFEISQGSDTEFIVTFMQEFMEVPTCLAFPLWFPKDGVYPAKMGEVMLASRFCDKKECMLQVGTPSEDGVPEDKNLGFSFIAFDGALKDAGIVHGNVGSYRGEQGEVGNDFVVADSFVGNNFNASRYGQFGILIQFHQKFLDIPSVIVTPRIGTFENLSGEYIVNVNIVDGGPPKNKVEYEVPAVYVEHVTTSQVMIRAFIVNTGETPSSQIAFSFVAVGPVAKT